MKVGCKAGPINFECCRSKQIGPYCVCILCDSLLHIACAERKKFISFGRVLGVCSCRNELATGGAKLTKDQATINTLTKKLEQKVADLNKLREENEILREQIDGNNVSALSKESVEEVSCDEDRYKEKIAGQEKLIAEMLDKNNILKDHVDQLKENIVLLKEKLDMTGVNLEANAYSSAVLNNIPKIKPAVPAIIIEAKKNQDVGVLLEEAKKILRKKQNVQLNKVAKVRNKIIVECNKLSDVDDTFASLNKLSDDNTTDVSVERKLNPRLKVTNIDYDFGTKDNQLIIQDIKLRNSLSDDCTLDVKQKYSRDNVCWSLILEVDAASYAKMMKTRKLYVGANRCPVYDNFFVSICNSCSGYGHTSKKCSRSLTPSCRYCAGNHLSEVCDNKEVVRCCNCRSYNLKFKGDLAEDHNAGDKTKCGTYVKTFKRFLSRIDYPYDPFDGCVK